MTGALLRLAGPLQSWGEHSTFAERDTLAFPTRSGITGLLSCALGRDRSQPPGELNLLQITIRVDRAGTDTVDFHTVGGGLPRNATVPTAESERHKPAYRSKANALISRRHYLADAAFLVALDGPDHVIDEISSALAAPVWPLYLGRRSCPPAEPVLLATGLEDALGHLDIFPLPRIAPRGQDTVSVDFVREAPADSEGDAAGPGIEHEVWDVPQSFGRFNRRYTSRRVLLEPRDLPAALCAGLGIHYMDRIAQHLRGIAGATLVQAAPA
ncbi:CRISPR system Cascade subunit CasD [Catenulispora sp. EB89]|uniref:type I-E CRISPR-associated protein Cas5/CasD n=1 Tax=Catenulispora sp. EB89 TaxID=3156257 RepID=UPI00351382DE